MEKIGVRKATKRNSWNCWRKTGGLRDEDARTVAQDLVKADMRGLYSHGISRIPMYLKRIEAGCVKARPEIQVEQAGAAVLKVDGDAGGI